LDINTPKGQISLQQENKMLRRIEDYWGAKIIETDKEKPSTVDGFLVKNNIIVGVFESKCRNLSLDELNGFGSWLITAQKIEKGRLISEYVGAPFLGFLYLLKDDKIMFWKITDDTGVYLFDFEAMETETQATINGGRVVRKNAYLPVEHGQMVESRKRKK
jgi:hypothetical protein